MKTKRPAFFLVLVILFLLLGFGIWKIGLAYIGLLSHTSSPVKQQTIPQQAATGTSLLSLPGFDFWTCQVGVFMIKDNAIDAMTSFNQSGWQVQVIGENPWTVGIGYAHTQEELSTLRQELKAKGVDVVAKKFVVPERVFRVTGKKEESLLSVIENINLLLKDDFSAFNSNMAVMAAAPGEVQDKGLEDLQKQISLLETMRTEEQQIYKLNIYTEFQTVLNKLTQTR